MSLNIQKKNFLYSVLNQLITKFMRLWSRVAIYIVLSQFLQYSILKTVVIFIESLEPSSPHLRIPVSTMVSMGVTCTLEVERTVFQAAKFWYVYELIAGKFSLLLSEFLLD